MDVIIRPKYEISEEFHRVKHLNEFYEISIGTMDGEIIKITLDDFAQSFNAKQAAEVARCIFEVLTTMKETRLSHSSSLDGAPLNEYEKVFNKFVPGKSGRSKQNLLKSWDQKNCLYIAAGVFIEPEAMLGLLHDKNAKYDITIASATGERLEMRLGMFAMEFTEQQALWMWFHLSLAADCLGQYTWRGDN